MKNLEQANNIYLLGDIHGQYDEITRACHKLNKKHGAANYALVQLGDFGLGFPGAEKRRGIWIPNGQPPDDPKSFPTQVKFIRGNHDNPEYCRKYPNYLGDYGYNEELGLFFVSGAMSHDKQHRTEGLDWWAGEELSYAELQDCIDLYAKIKPNVVISHEPPVVAHRAIRKGKRVDSSRTSQALQAMWEIHRPKFWAFGHMHVIFDKKIEGTKFQCAAINQVIQVKYG
jgi:predicted phosphodiesterase